MTLPNSLQDYLDLPVIGGDSASENDSDEKSDIVEGDNLWSEY